MNNTLNQYVFSYEGIINKEELDDIWSIYKVDHKEGSQYVSLYDALFTINLCIKSPKSQSFYEVTHGQLFQLLTGPDGLSNLASLIKMICNFLNIIHEMGMNYGNLRSENILLKFSLDGSRIESIKFINFGYVLFIGEHESHIVPE